MVTSKTNEVRPHVASVLSVDRDRIHMSLQDVDEWVAYGKKSAISNFILIHHLTVIPSISVILFSTDAKIVPEGTDAEIRCNGWMRFILDGNQARLLLQFREIFNAMLYRWLENARFHSATAEEAQLVKVLVTVLEEEDDVEANIRSKHPTI